MSGKDKGRWRREVRRAARRVTYVGSDAKGTGLIVGRAHTHSTVVATAGVAAVTRATATGRPATPGRPFRGAVCRRSGNCFRFRTSPRWVANGPFIAVSLIDGIFFHNPLCHIVRPPWRPRACRLCVKHVPCMTPRQPHALIACVCASVALRPVAYQQRDLSCVGCAACT